MQQQSHKKQHFLLAIESSCDETACAVLTLDGACLSHQLISQQEHIAFGGVVPEIAARAHLQALRALVRKALSEAQITSKQLSAIAASTGPGLIGGLIVGSNFGKAMAVALNIPFIAINHIEAHALSVRIPQKGNPPIAFPYLLLLLSGGHCACVAVNGVGHYKILGQTIDDAAGEAFDKTAKMLDLPWPGGPSLEKLAKKGKANIALPHPLCRQDNCDFSFSGLKTAVAQKILHMKQHEDFTAQRRCDLAASFQKTTAQIIANRVSHALSLMPSARYLAVAGGVAANMEIRHCLENIAQEHHIGFHAPELQLCTDNAIMVGWAACEILKLYEKKASPFKPQILTRPRPRWGLEEMQHPVAVET